MEKGQQRCNDLNSNILILANIHGEALPRCHLIVLCHVVTGWSYNVFSSHGSIESILAIYSILLEKWSSVGFIGSIPQKENVTADS